MGFCGINKNEKKITKEKKMKNMNTKLKEVR
jgi:hypothetical protein